MKFQLVFFLAFIGSSQAQGLPGVICGITGILCPPTTVAPTTTTTSTTTTADDTSELCFTVPGGNINIVIDPTQLTQTEIDQIKQLLENSLTNVLSSLGGTINGALNGLVGGLTGILTPATTPAPTGDGQICVVIHDQDIISRLTAFFDCLETVVDEQFKPDVNRIRMELNTLELRFNECDGGYVCLTGVAYDALELVKSIPGRFSTVSQNVINGINQCITNAANA